MFLVEGLLDGTVEEDLRRRANVRSFTSSQDLDQLYFRLADHGIVHSLTTYHTVPSVWR